MHAVWEWITAAMAGWHGGKVFVEHSIALGHDALHVIVGVLVWLLASLLVRRPISSWRPWLWLFAIILWNETVDLWLEQWPSPAMQYGEGAKDVLLTMLLPTVMMVAARARPAMFRVEGGRRRR